MISKDVNWTFGQEMMWNICFFSDPDAPPPTRTADPHIPLYQDQPRVATHPEPDPDLNPAKRFSSMVLGLVDGPAKWIREVVAKNQKDYAW